MFIKPEKINIYSFLKSIKDNKYKGYREYEIDKNHKK